MKLYKAWVQFFAGTLVVIVLLSALMMFIFYQTSESQETARLESVEAFVKQQKSELILNITNNIITEITLQSVLANEEAISKLDTVLFILEMANADEIFDDGTLAALINRIANHISGTDILALNLETGHIFGVMENRSVETTGDQLQLTQLFNSSSFYRQAQINNRYIIRSCVPRETLDFNVLSTVQAFIDAQVPLGDLQIRIDALNCYGGNDDFAVRIVTPFFQHEQHALINAGNADYYEGFDELIRNGHVTEDFYVNGELDRIVHARLFRPFDWIVSVSVSAYDINELTNGLAEQFQKNQTNAMAVLFLICVVFIVLAIFVFFRSAKLFSRKAATEFKHADELAQIDPLTTIYNRRYMEDGLTTIIDYLSRTKGELSILLLDIDYFKLYNDTYGHHMGDMCLEMVAKGLKATLSRSKDFVARYGGEEFIIVLPGTGELGAILIADRIMETMRALAIEHKKNVISEHVTVSIGIASGKVSMEKMNWYEYVDTADKALYHSKENGRNRYTHFTFEQT